MLKVLVALDQSPISVRAARESTRLFPGAEFLVVNVTQQYVPWVQAGDFGTVYPITPVELHDVDVVVVSSHDKVMLRRLLDPSVAQAVVQGTYRPVLVASGEAPPT
jgi:hypothetical protein